MEKESMLNGDDMDELLGEDLDLEAENGEGTEL